MNRKLHPALGVDYGSARIGIAATDDFGIMAHPVATVRTHAPDALHHIREIVAKRKIKSIILGLPLLLDGSEGTSAKRVREFSNTLAAALPALPIIFIDETFTTSDATEKLRAAGKNARAQKSVIDQAAAVEILNRWMGESG